MASKIGMWRGLVVHVYVINRARQARAPWNGLAGACRLGETLTKLGGLPPSPLIQSTKSLDPARIPKRQGHLHRSFNATFIM